MYSAIALVPTQCLAIGRSAYAKMCELQPEFEDVVKKQSTLYKHNAVHAQLLMEAYSARRAKLDTLKKTATECLDSEEARDRALLRRCGPTAHDEEEAEEGVTPPGDDGAAFASALLALVESAAPDVQAVIRAKLVKQK